VPPAIHLLRELRLPARYEALVRRVGSDVAQLLVDPGETTRARLNRLTRGVENQGEGAFIPLVASPGTGKTTLANNMPVFIDGYAQTVVHDGDVTAEALTQSVATALTGQTQQKIVPISIDHRETAPPSQTELAAIKRFLRTDIGAKSVILWPETSEETARDMAERWRTLAGEPPVELPIVVEGPARDLWVQTANATLELSNAMIADISELGVDPSSYDPGAYPSLGEFMKAISGDFSNYVQSLIEEADIPLRLIVLFVSQSAGQGILSELTSGGRFGFVDAKAVLQATGGSQIGRWWAEHRGLRTQALVRLDMRALALSPTASVAAMRRYGPDDVQSTLAEQDVHDGGDAAIARTFERTDLGRLLRGDERSATETRGTPPTRAQPAFARVAEKVGFGGGKDKSLNRALSQALHAYMTRESIDFETIVTETKLPQRDVIPDIAVRATESITCIEPTWRKSEFLVSTNRSSAAQYILRKLYNYCETLGWV
jgi:hypothetical protein